MKKLVKLTGSNLSRIVKKVIKEQLEDELDLSGSNDWDNIYGDWERAVETGEAHGGCDRQRQGRHGQDHRGHEPGRRSGADGSARPVARLRR